MQQCAADVVAIAVAAAHRIGRGHDVASVIINQAGKEGAGLDPRLPSRRAIVRKPGLDRAPELLVHNCLVLAGIRHALVDDLAPIDAVLEEMVERTPAERAPTEYPAGRYALLAAHATLTA